MKKWIKEKILDNNKNTLLLVLGCSFFVLAIYQIILLCRGTYFNSNSDDVVQYAPILIQYINNLKSGNIGWFNFVNGFGASVFSDVYYVPIDIFSLLTFLLTFVMNDYVAFSCVELVKVVLGVVTFAYFLQKCKYNNKIVLMLSLMYFATSGAWSFSTYPTYFSLIFYLPASLLVVKYFIEGKKWLLPLYGFILILYNFYNAYTLFVFMTLVYIVIMIRDHYVGIKKLIKDTLVFVCHILLSVLMGMFILLPSVLYIVKWTGRNEGTFSILFDLKVYLKMLYKLFVYESGVDNLQNGMAFTGTYANSQYSFYVGVLGMYILLMLFFLKDRVSKLYKWVLLSLVIMMVLPIFSMIFSGVGLPYVRWFSYIQIILLCFIGHVINLNECSFCKNKKNKTVFLVLIVLYLISLVSFFVAGKITNNIMYLVLLVNILIGLICFSLFIVFWLTKQENLIVCSFVVEMIIAIAINLYIPFKTNALNNNMYYGSIKGNLDGLNISNYERTYLHSSSYNLNRRMNTMMSENVFHSFFSKDMKMLEIFVGDNAERNTTFFLANRYDPYYARILDYKYIMVDKTSDVNDPFNNYPSLFTLEKENENYIVYKNNNYNPFYVYESFYDEEKVFEYENVDMLFLEEKLYDGVIIEGKYALNEEEFIYTDESKFIELNSKLELIKENDVYVHYATNYVAMLPGTLEIKGESVDDLRSVQIVENGVYKKCEKENDLYTCDFDRAIDKIVIETNGDINDDLYYYIKIRDEDDNLYFYYKIDDDLKNKTINYYINNSASEYAIFVNKNGDSQKCMYGFCNFENFDVDYVLLKIRFYIEENNKMYYKIMDLSDYASKNDKSLASNKNLSYNNSAIRIKYHRESVTSNDQVIVLPVTYSDEWKVSDSNYEVVRANGGFVGIVVKNGVSDIDVTLEFVPSGVRVGSILSRVGIGLYVIYVLLIFYKKKVREEAKDLEG